MEEETADNFFPISFSPPHLNYRKEPYEPVLKMVGVEGHLPSWTAQDGLSYLFTPSSLFTLVA